MIRKLRSYVTTILLFCVNFSLKLLLSGFTYAQNVPDKLQGEYLIICFKKAQPIISFLVFFVEIASKHEKFSLKFSSFNPLPSLPSVATNDRKQNKCHNIVLNNKPGPLFLEFSFKGKTYFGF